VLPGVAGFQRVGAAQARQATAGDPVPAGPGDDGSAAGDPGVPNPSEQGGRGSRHNLPACAGVRDVVLLLLPSGVLQ